MARILVVDDEPVVRSLFRTVLEREGHAVEEARDGHEGLAAYVREPADLVIVDLVLPGMNGMTMIATLKRSDPEARVVPMTGILASLCPPAKLAAVLGASSALTKPLTADEILGAVRGALRERG